MVDRTASTVSGVSAHQHGVLADVPLPDLDVFRKQARDWLEANAKPLAEVSKPESTAGESEAMVVWGHGSDNVAVFDNIGFDKEQRLKFDAGYALLNWPVAVGGRGLSNSYVRSYLAEERSTTSRLPVNCRRRRWG